MSKTDALRNLNDAAYNKDNGVSILPSGTKLDPEHPEKNEFAKDWLEDSPDGVIYFIDLHPGLIFAYSSGELGEKFKPGSRDITFVHDQTGRFLGNGEIQRVVKLSELSGKHKGARPLYVFK